MRTLAALALVLGAAAGQETQTAEQAYKNIQVFQGVPSSKLMPAMSFMMTSLGVNCPHCHIPNQFEKDDRPAKQAARRMIHLTRAINREHYGGRNVVNCYTCHQGKLQPGAVPAIVPPAPPGDAAQPGAAAAGPLPTAEEVLERCIEAAGGRAALAKVTTRALKGILEIPGRRAPLERIQKAPNKLLMTAQLGNTPTRIGYNGANGWEQNPAGTAREMGDEDRARIETDAEFHRELGLRRLYRNLVLKGRESLAGRQAFVLEGVSRQGIPAKLSFDAQTGLLLRIAETHESLLGPLPFRTEYEDYREVDGVKVPFVVRWLRPDVALTMRFEEVRHNRPLNDELFEKPAAK